MALETYCAEARMEHFRATFRVAEGGQTAWLRGERIDGTPEERLPIELFPRRDDAPDDPPRGRIGLAAPELRLQSDERPGLGELEPFSRMEIRFGCPVTAIAIPRLLDGDTPGTGHPSH